MITITRRLAQQLRSVLRRAFGNFRGTGPTLAFVAAAEELIVKSVFGDIAVEYRLPSKRPADTLWLPFEFLADVAGKNDEPVDLAESGDNQVSVHWRTGNVPQIVKYDIKQPFEFDKFPALPTAFTTNPVGLLQALDAAAEVTAHEGVRYALDCIQLSPDGTINATDGHQLLIQSGFTFPWQDAVLVPRNKVFTCTELPQDMPAAIAKSGDWVAVRAGRWTVYLRVTASRYPRVADIVPNPDAAKARCQFSKDDIRFLVETLPNLPCEDEDNLPVTIDLNGSIAIRAKEPDKECVKGKPTEVVLTNSQWTGEPIRVNINRTYLQRAMKLGLNDLLLYGNEATLLCQSFDRKLVWAPLGPGAAIEPTENAIRIESPKSELAAPIPQPVTTPRSISPMSEPTANTNNSVPASQAKADTTRQTSNNGQPRKTSSRKAALQDLATLIEEAEKLRTAAHVLVQGLKQHRRQNKATQQMIAQLRTLKTLGV